MGWRSLWSELLGGPPKSDDGARCHQVILGATTVDFQLNRSARRSIGLQIDQRGLTVRAPQRATLRDIEQALQSKSPWILRKLQEWRTRPIAGALEPSANTPANPPRDGETAASALSPAQVRALKRQARALFAQRLVYFEQQHACVPVRWSLTSARTRWGSCSPGGHVRLNWRLVHLPLPIVDYVIAHELAHLEELNHGPRFWLRVEVLYPEWRRERNALRAYRLDPG